MPATIKITIAGIGRAPDLAPRARRGFDTLATGLNGDVAIGDIVPVASGFKVGTAATQKIGFFGDTPVDQPAAVADATDAASVILRLNELLARMRELGLIET
jgi:hypothetical protein